MFVDVVTDDCDLGELPALAIQGTNVGGEEIQRLAFGEADGRAIGVQPDNENEDDDDDDDGDAEKADTGDAAAK